MMASSSDLQQCYNVSCGQQYREEENHDQACQYHPGRPYFHDGYKEWTCCKMKSRDFSVFMSFKGCTKGRHNNVKPDEPVKPLNTSETLSPDSTITIAKQSGDSSSSSNNDKSDTSVEPFIPPDPDLVQKLPIIEHPNVATAPVPQGLIKICKYCKQEESTLDMNKPCHYHKGVQIFHDAYKFWSCCQHKKFSDFEDFQRLPPCASAEHHELIVKVEHKENWFQTGSTVTLALYGLKGARNVPDSVVTVTGGKKLHAQLANIDGMIIFDKQWTLCDYVRADHPQTRVQINPSNVQIVLQKSNERHHWPSLEPPPEKK